MKIFNHLLAVACLLLLVASCSDNIVNEAQSNNQIITKITAYAESGCPTKTGLEDNADGGKNVVWRSGNAISLFFNTGNNGGSQFTTTNSGAIATFTGSISAVSGNLSDTGGSAYFWAVYPYNSNASCDGNTITTQLPSSQTAYAGDIADNLLITFGRSQNLAIYFRNVCSVIEFTLKKENITKVSFSGGNNEIIAGRFQASFDDNKTVVSTPTANNTVKTISITPAESQIFSTGTKYYLVLLPGRFSNGYSLTFTRSDGFKATYTSTADITLEAGKFYTMYDKDNGLIFKGSSSNTVPTPSAIDLGLSVKWASFNLGASSRTESGDYYGWGEFKATSTSGWTGGYRFVSGYSNNEPQFTKYNTKSTYGPIDNNTVLDAVDDVVNVKLGGKWRMPTKEEMEELLTQCTWTWKAIDDVGGYSVQGSNGKSIFIPLTGWKDGGQVKLTDHGFYWTSSLYTDVPTAAHYLTFYKNSLGSYREVKQAPRYYGLPIRPVQEK